MENGVAKQCGICGRALEADAVFCAKCGARYAPPTITAAPAAPEARPAIGRVCPNCGQALAWDQLFCPGCGHNCSKI